jgi:hypothetical protein
MTDKSPPASENAARARENPVAFARLAGILLVRGNAAQAREIALGALRAAPEDPEVRSLAGRVLAHGVPDWHFRIVQDAARNAAYEAALKRAVTPETKVLEIGTGSGILAMMAARAGAREVVACEMMPAIAEAAQEIVARNGFSDRVRVVSQNVSLGLFADGATSLITVGGSTVTGNATGLAAIGGMVKSWGDNYFYNGASGTSNGTPTAPNLTKL